MSCSIFVFPITEQLMEQNNILGRSYILLKSILIYNYPDLFPKKYFKVHLVNLVPLSCLKIDSATDIFPE